MFAVERIQALDSFLNLQQFLHVGRLLHLNYVLDFLQKRLSGGLEVAGVGRVVMLESIKFKLCLFKAKRQVINLVFEESVFFLKAFEFLLLFLSIILCVYFVFA